MRVQSAIGVMLGGVATAALAQVATAPIEQKSGANAAAASNDAVPASRSTPANGQDRAPKDETAPANPANGTAPDEPK